MKAFFINDLHIDQWVKIQSKAGYVSTATYKKLLEKWCIPADAIFIAGDIASSVNAVYATFVVLSKMYDHIFYCYGNHELRMTDDDASRGLTTYTKRERIEQFIDTAVNKLDKVHFIKGSTAYVNGVRVSGSMGYSDGKFSTSADPASDWLETNDAKKFNLGWTSDMSEIAKYENDSLSKILSDEPLTKVVMSHFAPYQLLDSSKFNSGFDPGLSTFDASPMLNSVRDGAIWHFGHVHDKIKREINIDGKRILAINNSIGTKDKKPISDIPREEFLLTL